MLCLWWEVRFCFWPLYSCRSLMVSWYVRMMVWYWVMICLLRFSRHGASSPSSSNSHTLGNKCTCCNNQDTQRHNRKLKKNCVQCCFFRRKDDCIKTHHCFWLQSNKKKKVYQHCALKVVENKNCTKKKSTSKILDSKKCTWWLQESVNIKNILMSLMFSAFNLFSLLIRTVHFNIGHAETCQS